MIVPSIDVRAARVVARGAAARGMPSEIAERYVSDGAEELHLVDLDSAERGEPANLALLSQIARRCGVPARLAGGISSVALAREAMDAGFSGVLFSSAVFADDSLLQDIARLGRAAIVEIESRDGWLEPRGGDPEMVELVRGRGVLASVRAALQAGVRELYAIDLGGEGALAGPPLALVDEVRACFGAKAVRLHAGGGVRELDDVRALADRGCASVTIGRALAEGRFSIEEAKRAGMGT